jgi:hypothetical protein
MSSVRESPLPPAGKVHQPGHQPFAFAWTLGPTRGHPLQAIATRDFVRPATRSRQMIECGK